MNYQVQRSRLLKKIGKGLLALTLLTGLLNIPAYADESSEQDIRVALFVDAGSTYKSTVPAVTLQSDQALSAGIISAAGYVSWISLNKGQSVRFSVDGYKVKALDTPDFVTATTAVKKLQATVDKPILFSLEQTSGTTYQIFTGPYSSVAESKTAADRVAQTLASIKLNEKPAARGQSYYSTGIFNTMADAELLRKQISDQSIDAFVVMNNPGQYTVWVGGLSSDNELNQLKTQLLQVMPQLQLVEVNAALPALIIRNDVTLDLTSPAPVTHYVVSGTGSKLWVQSSDTSTILVSERSARKYRGSFEITKQNNQLALVNQLPLEQYLYSVVGGEVPSSWHLEALKAQAVAARSYALYQASNKFQIAPVVDTTLSQVYSGVVTEAASIIQAVDSTAGETINYNGKIVEGIFSSNSGGVTADSVEVWNSSNSVFASVASETDVSAEAGLMKWYYVLLPNGSSGYAREDNVKLTGSSTNAGLPYMTVTAQDTNIRPNPLIQSGVDPVAKMNPGDQAVVLQIVKQSNSYSWIRGPFTSDELVKSLAGKTTTPFSSTIMSLEVTQRGTSGRVTQIKANGQVLDVKYPDAFRSALNGLPSTLFDIVPTGRYTVLSAGGTTVSGTASTGTPVLSASGQQSWTGGNMVVLNGKGEARPVTSTNNFLFVGTGNGHGLGLSQWGAKGMADTGYDYKQILQHYYSNVTISK